MIDFHSHILPGFDDGLETPEEALEFARQAAAAGIKKIMATPHHAEGYYTCRTDQVVQGVAGLNELFAGHGVAVEVLPSAELYLDPRLPVEIKEGLIPTVNLSGKYVLIELPMQDIPAYAEDVLFEIALSGVTPIIAHPERNAQIIADPNRLYNFVSKGIAAQLNLGSLLGRYGRRVRAAAEILLKNRMVQVVGSDTHHAGRVVDYKGAFGEIARLAGKEYLAQVTEVNPDRILLGEPLDLTEARPVKKKLFGIF